MTNAVARSIGKLFAFLLLSSACLVAQTQTGQLIASQFGRWSVPGVSPNTYQWPSQTCTVQAGLTTIFAFTAGTPIKIVDADPAMSEVVTPSPVINQNSLCSISVGPSHPHYSFNIKSGTVGLQEAINSVGPIRKAVIYLTQDWYDSGATAGTIAGATGSSNIALIDMADYSCITGSAYLWSGSAYVKQACGAAGITALTGDGTASGTGSVAFTLANTAVTPGSYAAANITVDAKGRITSAANGAAGSTKVVFTSKLSGIHGDALVAPGSVTYGTDDAAALNTALSGGGLELVVDGQYGLSSHLTVSSNTKIRCLPGMGFIMRANSNDNLLQNATQNVPTTAGGGSFVVSNVVDHDIGVEGCILNGNSTNAVTEATHRYKDGTATGIALMNAQFLGVRNLAFRGNTLYDSPTWAFLGSNVTNFWIENNYVQVPAPAVTNKNTDGYHIVGPADHGWLKSNHCYDGDDCYSLNADDANLVASGDPVQPHYTPLPVKQGSITDIEMDGNTCDASAGNISTGSCYRLLSCVSLVDRIQIRNATGLTDGTPFQMSCFYPALGGGGNFGTILVDGWDIKRDNPTGSLGPHAEFYIQGNAHNVNLAHILLDKALVSHPLIYKDTGTVGLLSVDGLKVNNPTGTAIAPYLIGTNGGSIANFSASNVLWNDATADTATVFGGAAPPTTVTFSNYSGPNRILAAGYVPTYLNGDAFQNTYTTTYINTTFAAEATSGALATTTPATCTNGCVPPWTLASGPGFTYTNPGITQSTAATNPTLITVGTNNFVMRFTITSAGTSAGSQVVARYTDATHGIFLVVGRGGVYDLYDYYVGHTGGAADISSVSTGGTDVGSWILSVNGTTISVTPPNGVTTTITSGNTNTAASPTNLGLNQSGTGTMSLSSLSAKSN